MAFAFGLPLALPSSIGQNGHIQFQGIKVSLLAIVVVIWIGLPVGTLL
jgi:hypothetical protein